ncbi:MAG: DNA translocase FtsK [Eubacterium sp.]|nr:DNA translocase FtsK [Eubacterium sp.]
MANKKRKPVKKVQDASPLAREIILLVIIVFSILSLLSLFDLCGAGGRLLSGLLFGLFGAVSYIFPICLLVASGFFISNPDNSELKRKIIYSAGLYICLCGIFQWVIDSKAEGLIEVFRFCSSERTGGGLLGGILSYLLTLLAGRAGSLVIILGLTLLFVMLITRKLIFAAIRDLYEEKSTKKDYIDYEDYEEHEEAPAQRQMKVHTFEKKKEKETKRKRKKAQMLPVEPELEVQEEKEPAKEEPKADAVPEEKERPNISIIRGSTPASTESPVYQEELDTKFGNQKADQNLENRESNIRESKTNESKTEDPKAQIQQIEEEIKKPESKKESAYVFPSLDLLSQPKAGNKGLSDKDLIDTAAKLQGTLESFGVKVKMGDVSCGPSVTRYELVPEQGVKVSSITRLADDIKLSLAASDIRIEAPIPGKAAVGIEVPNAKRNMVTLRELLESREFQSAKSNVSFAVGKDISGKTIVTDIAKMPHMLVAGATGSGKSVCINTLIMSIIYKADPNDVKFIMVDPKMVELTAYADIPHLMIPVVTDPKKASAALNWAVQEMTVRYNKFAELGVRDIKSYNKKIAGLKYNEENTYEKMCQIVIIVDEFADLMMVAPGEVEDAVCRLAQLARAAGIHLVLATQRPSVNVITGLIKANIPSRIALSVSSAIDSRTIIDSAGAEKLLGNGDMLFAPQDYPKPVRIQGAFVSDEERDDVVAFLKQQQSASYNEEITKHIEANPVGGKTGAAGGAPGGNERDELFVEVGRFIIEKDKASIGMLQRVFRIGFNRAARIMDQLCDAGVVGPEEGTKPRTILMSMEQFENYLETEG